MSAARFTLLVGLHGGYDIIEEKVMVLLKSVYYKRSRVDVASKFTSLIIIMMFLREPYGIQGTFIVTVCVRHGVLTSYCNFLVHSELLF